MTQVLSDTRILRCHKHERLKLRTLLLLVVTHIACDCTVFEFDDCHYWLLLLFELPVYVCMYGLMIPGIVHV